MTAYPYPKGDWKEDWHKPSTPKVLTVNDLFPQFNRWAIGFDPLFDTFKHVAANTKTSGYPPYNIYKNDAQWILELAVAGFGKKDITISVQELSLTVEGQLEASEEEPIHKGIATRDFKLELAVAEYWEVTNALMENGMLTVQFNKMLPEEKKPKVIAIS